MSDYKEQISKKRAELKEVFDNPAEDGKYSAEQKKCYQWFKHRTR